MMISIYPFYPVHEMGKFTHFVYGMFWVSFDHRIAQGEKGEELVTGKTEKNLH
jgi:hypothetical protein